jgi:hypothetical protein
LSRKTNQNNIHNICAKLKYMAKNLTTRDEDYSKWYNELVIKADLAEFCHMGNDASRT